MCRRCTWMVASKAREHTQSMRGSPGGDGSTRGAEETLTTGQGERTRKGRGLVTVERTQHTLNACAHATRRSPRAR